ncbi:hypothetical protein R6Z07M_019465 [Ovis aries]
MRDHQCHQGVPHARAPYLNVKTSSIQSTWFPAEVMQVPFLFSWMTNKVAATRSKSRRTPNHTPHNKVGTGAPGGGVPAPGPEAAGRTFGWAGRAPSLPRRGGARDPPTPGTPPRPRARPGLRRLPAARRARPLGRLPPRARGGKAAAAGRRGLALACRPSMSEVPCRKRDDYLEWPEYFMAVAFLSAQRSKDPNSQVGACIVNAENKIVGIGYNGMPNGCSDDLLPWRRTAENILDTKYPYVCHAELNAIMNKNSADVKGCTMYVALFPCNECAKLIIQAGIKEVIFMSDKYHDSNETTAARLMFEMAGISFRKFTPKCSQIVIDFDSINSRPSQKLQ